MASTVLRLPLTVVVALWIDMLAVYAWLMILNTRKLLAGYQQLNEPVAISPTVIWLYVPLDHRIEVFEFERVMALIQWCRMGAE